MFCERSHSLVLVLFGEQREGVAALWDLYAGVAIREVDDHRGGPGRAIGVRAIAVTSPLPATGDQGHLCLVKLSRKPKQKQQGHSLTQSTGRPKMLDSYLGKSA